MSDRVKVTFEGGVADVRLNRADKMNALDGAMFAALRETGAQLAGEPSVRAVVLSGEGRGFCAGLDFSSFTAMSNTAGSNAPEQSQPSAPSPSSLFEPGVVGSANAVQAVAWVWHELPVPVIAAVHGVAFGGGLQIALGADMRFVAPDARLSVMEIKWGLIPDMSGTQTLRHLVGLDVAKDLTYTGRQVLGAEAVRLGLATRVCDDPWKDAMQVAREIAGRSPDAIRSAKKLLNASPLVSVEEGLKLEAQLQQSLIGTPNQVEAVKANLQKRDAQFNDPS